MPYLSHRQFIHQKDVQKVEREYEIAEKQFSFPIRAWVTFCGYLRLIR